MHREDQDARPARDLLERGHQIEHAGPGHGHIEQHDVYQFLSQHLQEGVAVARLAHHADVGVLRQYRSQTVSHDLMIVGDDQANHRLFASRRALVAALRAPTGTVTRTTVPRLRPALMSNCPPIASIRSRIPTIPRDAAMSLSRIPMPSSSTRTASCPLETEAETHTDVAWAWRAT